MTETKRRRAPDELSRRLTVRLRAAILSGAATDPELALRTRRDSVSRFSRFRSVRMSAAC